MTSVTNNEIILNDFIKEIEDESGIKLSPTSIFLIILFTAFGFAVAVSYGYGIWFVCLFIMGALIAVLIGILINVGSNANLQIGPMTLVLGIVVICFYVFIGLYMTQGILESVGYILSWFVYTCLCLTILNVVLITIYWSVIRKKSGPPGIRGIAGNNGKQGEKGLCNMDSTDYNYISQMLTYIDSIYKEKTNDNTKSLLDINQKPINKYLDGKIYSMLTSHQIKTLTFAATEMNLTTDNILRYIKSIWLQWIDLLYAAGGEQWFTNSDGNETGPWLDNQNNPFDEIRKYDIYYWGMGRLFRPLKVSTCQSSSLRKNDKLPQGSHGNIPKLNIINTNDYSVISTDNDSGGKPDISWWRGKKVKIGNIDYHPLGDIPMAGDRDQVYYGVYKKGKTIIDKLEYDVTDSTNEGVISINGPDMQTILVGGDVKYPDSFQKIWQNDDQFKTGLYRPVCPSGYTSMGDIVMGAWDGTYKNNTISNVLVNKDAAQNVPVCVPSDCVTPIYSNVSVLWSAYNGKSMVKSLNTWTNLVDQGSIDDYGYNLMRGSGDGVLYKIKDSCIANNNAENMYKSKQLEESTSEIGIGWYGTPSPTDPKYSIFTFLNLVPEGVITNELLNKSFYIIHYGGEDANKFIILDYNNVSDKYDNALQVMDNNDIVVRNISRSDVKQQFIIDFTSNRQYFNLKSVYNNKFLHINNLTPAIIKLNTVTTADNNTKFKFTSATGVGVNIL
jgi:hypothetical protein